MINRLPEPPPLEEGAKGGNEATASSATRAIAKGGNEAPASLTMKKNAFTLLEVILAIFILTTAVASGSVLIQQTFTSVSLNQSKLIAYYLAQEGIEIVRNIRDNNWLEQRTNPDLSWKEGLGTEDYEVSYNDTELSPNQNRPLSIDDSDGFYSYSGGAPTKFKRKISISEVDDDTLQVTVLVTWTERGREHTAKVIENLHNWYGN